MIVLSAGAFFTLFLTDRVLFPPSEKRLPAESPPEIKGYILKGTFYKNIPKLRLQFTEGTKAEEIEWLNRYDIILLRYDPESGIAEIAVSDPEKDIVEMKQVIEVEGPPNLKTVSLVE